MKRIFIVTLMFVGLSVSAFAQKEALYYYNLQTNSFAIRNWIDRSAKMFYFDSDSESDAVMLMKNYKKNGNKETFDVYPKAYPNQKRGTITLITDPDLKVAKELDLSKQTVTESVDGYTQKFGFLTEKQRKMYDKLNGNGGGGSAEENGNVVDKAKDKAKGLLNKGKNLFKKKK